MGAEHGLLDGWFNGSAAPFVPPLAYEWSNEKIVTGGLIAHLADARTLIAMKMLSNRARDFEDLVQLVGALDIVDPGDLVRIVHQAYPDGVGSKMPSDEDLRSDGVGSKMPSDEDLRLDATEIIRIAGSR